MVFKNRVNNTADEGHDSKQSEVGQDHGIHLSLDFATLAGGAAGIESELGVKTGVHDDPDDPRGIP